MKKLHSVDKTGIECKKPKNYRNSQKANRVYRQKIQSSKKTTYNNVKDKTT